MNVRQKTLTALLVLGIGINGCNNGNYNNPISPTVDKKTVDQNKTIDGNKTIDNNKTVDGNKSVTETKTATILGYIGSQHSNHHSTITVAQLQDITPVLDNIDDRYLNIYQRYIASADTNISSPATVDEVQSMIDEVNDFNLPEHFILDRSFFKKTNGVFEHRFVYLPVTNPNTGRTWLNNNLGADYANVDSSAYNASQQATATDDYLAYGSLFQWGRKADGHELMNWNNDVNGTGKYSTTTKKSDDPDKLFILDTSDKKDWRVHRDDTLWANESSANNVCPLGYRLPLDPNGANDSENEFAVEINTWSSKDVNGSMLSDLKMPAAGFRWTNGNRAYTALYGIYWGGSVAENNGRSLAIHPDSATPLYTTRRGVGSSIRCIKEQTPAERSYSILLEIGNEHSNHKSIITIDDLKAITPALENINDNYESSYQPYIANANNNFSSPATRDEVQRMIDEINSLIPASEAILADIATQHHNRRSDITIAQLKAILPALENINDDYILFYRGYIAGDPTISSPATRNEIQNMIYDTDDLIKEIDDLMKNRSKKPMLIHTKE